MTPLEIFQNPKTRAKLEAKDIEFLHAHFKKEYDKEIDFDFATAKGCREILKKKTWHEAIHDYATNFQWAMYSLILFRKKYVNETLAECAGNTPWAGKSVGSTDLTSDYDITIAAPQGQDVVILEKFNARVQEDFGKQPGTVFDTNVYVKDYGKVVDNLKINKSVESYNDSDVEFDAKNIASHRDQDLASLTKHRRYTTQDGWTKYVEQLKEGLSGPLAESVGKQYDTADALYQIAIAQLLAAMEKVLWNSVAKKKGHKLTENLATYNKCTNALGHVAALYMRFKEEVPLDGLSDAWKNASEGEPIVDGSNVPLKERMQLNNSVLLAHIRYYYEDLLLNVSNRLYVEAMKKIRELQAKEPQTDDVRGRIKCELGIAIFFASEAYHSEGAVFDIVMGAQEHDEEKKSKLREKLLPIHLLESFNEQYGDFLKDHVHYSFETQGYGTIYYRCSKYLSRLLSVVAEMQKKDCPTVKALKISQYLGCDENAFREAVEKLVLIRKGDFNLEGKSPEEKADELFKALGIEGAQEKGLKVRVEALACAFNVAARKDIGIGLYEHKDDGVQMKFKAILQQERPIFGNPQHIKPGSNNGDV